MTELTNMNKSIDYDAYYKNKKEKLDNEYKYIKNDNIDIKEDEKHIIKVDNKFSFENINYNDKDKDVHNKDSIEDIQLIEDNHNIQENK